ncbi:MAG: ABC-type lipoprotein release transport system permease subunit [Arenicella sp.]|jgi:ABC-type lipoprotein release transport system permease subunit
MDEQKPSREHLPIVSLWVMAWRNLWRNYRRTAIMLAAISIGVWAMIFMSALMRGMVDDMLRRGIDQLPGHVQMHNKLFLDDPSIVNSMPEPGGSLQQELDKAPIDKWFSRIKVPAMIASERDSRGVTLLGIDPLLERKSILNSAHISEGRFLESVHDRGILIGEKLANRLETRLGKRVVITSQDRANNLAESGVRIVGIYKAELPLQEEMFIYMGKATAQNLLSIEGMVSEVAVFGDDYRNAILLQQSVAGAVDASQAFKDLTISVNKWSEVNRYLASTVEVMDGFVLIWIVVIFIALSFGLANTLIMAIFERVREIGLMLALGMRPLLVTWQILFESLLLLIIGLLIGNVLAVISVFLVADGIDLSAVAQGFEMGGMGTTLYPLLLLKDMLTANLVVISLGLITSLLPAWRAARYDPIRALSKST